MEQLHESKSSPILSENWKNLDSKEIIKILNKSTVNDVIQFGRSSSEAKKFIIENKANIEDLNPISIMIEDIFPTIVDNVYEFSVLVRMGRVNSSANSEEIIRVQTESDLRDVLDFLSPDILQVKLTYPSSFEDDFRRIICRPLTHIELEELKKLGIIRQIKRQNEKKRNYLANNGFTEDNLNEAKEQVLFYGSPKNMSVDVYDTAIALEESEKQLILELNLMEHNGFDLNDNSEVVELNCLKSDTENFLC